MRGALVASPSAFLRIGLVQQLRLHRPRLLPSQAATTDEALRVLAEGATRLAIIDDVLMAEPHGDDLRAMLQRHPAHTLLIATGHPGATPPSPAALGRVDLGRVVAGTVDGVLDMGAIARALPEALDALGAGPGFRRPAWVAPVAPTRVAGAPPRLTPTRPEIILVAASTGGPTALAILLHRLGRSPLPMVVAQHMPADQTASLARHLAAETGLEVIELGSGEIPTRAHVTVLRGGSDYRIVRGTAGRFRVVATEMAGNVFHPSADLLFGSAAAAGLEAIAVVLSGMGQDGARGAAAIAERGGGVLVQDFASCVVAGMPSAAQAACATAAVMTVPAIAQHLCRWTAPAARSLAAGRER
ncbi:MAG: CheB methylesterase domain-containing protein [Xanthobacteraceae bacterium]|jgi:two-component system chemotaxis response regulator CheB